MAMQRSEALLARRRHRLAQIEARMQEIESPDRRSYLPVGEAKAGYAVMFVNAPTDLRFLLNTIRQLELELTLLRGEAELASDNRRLTFQADGNLVVYSAPTESKES